VRALPGCVWGDSVIWVTWVTAGGQAAAGVGCCGGGVTEGGAVMAGVFVVMQGCQALAVGECQCRRTVLQARARGP
jgi:hypothetical protein